MDVNRGDEYENNYRRRLVGKEFKTSADDAWYATAPPLEALRFILSDATTLESARGTRVPSRQVMASDVARA